MGFWLDAIKMKGSIKDKIFGVIDWIYLLLSIWTLVSFFG